MLASVHPLVTAGGTLTAVGVWIAGDRHTGLQLLRHTTTYSLDGGTHLMAGNDGIQGHRITAHKRVDVRTAEAHVVQFQQYFALAGSLRLFHLNDIQFL